MATNTNITVPKSTTTSTWTLTENKEHAEAAAKLKNLLQSKSAEKPESKPTEKPASKPAEKPASKPATKSAPRKPPVKARSFPPNQPKITTISNSDKPAKPIDKTPEFNPTIFPKFGTPQPKVSVEQEVLIKTEYEHSLNIPRSYDAALAIAKRAGLDPNKLVREHKERRKFLKVLDREYFGYGETSELENVMGEKERQILSFKVTCSSLFLILFLLYMMYGIRHW